MAGVGGASARVVMALLGLAALMSGAMVACEPLSFTAVPQQNCVAKHQGTLGPEGGVIMPLAARDPTDKANSVSSIYALNASDGALAWSCASTTYSGWNDVQRVNGVIYALAGTEYTHEGAPTHVHAIYAIRPRDGKQLWAYSFRAGTAGPLAFGGGLLFATTVTGEVTRGFPGHHAGDNTPPPAQWGLLAIHADSGALAWSATLAGDPGQPVPVAGRVVVPLNNGGNEWSLQAFNGATGATAWSYQLSRGVADLITLATRDGALYAEVDRSLIALDGASGAVRWSRMIPLPASGVNSALGLAQFTANAIIAPQDQGVSAFELATGAPLWSAPMGQFPTIWVSPDQRVYALTDSANNTPDRLVALDGDTGNTIWSRDVSNLQGLGLTPGAGGQVYMTAPTGARFDESVVAVDARGADRWRHDGTSPYNSGILLQRGADLYYIWQAPNGVAAGNPADTTYVTLLNASDGSERWQTALPGLNGDAIAPTLVP
ncbi:MAG TPA: PQQ-binding-like beta-propeller repeat protein [Ktedonobacterales bacterium]